MSKPDFRLPQNRFHNAPVSKSTVSFIGVSGGEKESEDDTIKRKICGNCGEPYKYAISGGSANDGSSKWCKHDDEVRMVNRESSFDKQVRANLKPNEQAVKHNGVTHIVETVRKQ